MLPQPGPLHHAPPCDSQPVCRYPAAPAAGLDVSTLREAMQLIGDRKVETEASGNVTLDTVRCACLGCAYLGCCRQPRPAEA